MLTKLFIVLAFLLAPIQLCGQTLAHPPVSKMNDTETAELEATLAEAGKLDDKLATINVKARAAALVSFSDPIRAEQMFLGIWHFAKEQTDKDFDKEQAQSFILKYIFPRNPKLAKQLLNEDSKPGESSVELRATGHDPSLRAGIRSCLFFDRRR